MNDRSHSLVIEYGRDVYKKYGRSPIRVFLDEKDITGALKGISVDIKSDCSPVVNLSCLLDKITFKGTDMLELIEQIEAEGKE